ncbi:MAG: CHAT domain-containing protein [Rhodocyclaceae bacterium]|nr:CHAT domain-containing protein [Rhodocyclaceae bacterium]
MIPRRFYHLALLLPALLADPARAAADVATAPAALAINVPPRTIDDIARLLEHYKPDPQAAARLVAEAEAAPPDSDDRKALFQFYWLRGLSAGKAGRMSQQIADLRRAADYGDKGTADFVRMLRNLASAETQGGNLLNGARIAEDAWRQTPQNQKGQMLAAEQLLTRQYVLLGDFETARKHLREGEATFALLKRLPRWTEYGHNWTALMERARAEIFAAEGRLVEAEGAYRKSLRNVEQHLEQAQQKSLSEENRLVQDGILQFREGMERSLAGTLLGQGKLVEAEAYARQAVRHSLERVGRASIDTAQGLGLLARIIAEYGRNAEAARLAEEALHSFQSAGAVPESLPVAGARRALAGARVAQGNYAEAVGIFRAMHEGLKADPELQKQVGSGDLDWVLAMLRTGDQPGAERMAKAMLDYSVRHYGEKVARTAAARAFYAMTLAGRGDYRQARDIFAVAVPVLLDQVREDAEAGTGTSKRHQRLTAILESYIQTLSEIGKAQEDAAGAAEESFRLADIARGSAVQRALTSSAARANIADPKLAELARREQDAQRRIGALSELLTQLLGAPPEQQLPKIQAKMRADIDQLKFERDQLKKEIATRFPDYAELVDPKPATVAQAAKSLKPTEALLAFYFGEEGGFVWALKADGKAAFARVPMTHPQLRQDVAALRRALDPGVASIDDIPPFDLAIAHRLYARLLQPVQAAWQGATVLLAVPHAELGQLPLALLPTAAVAQPGRSAVPFAGYKAVPWLMNTMAVAQLPSVAALTSLRKLPPGDVSRRAFVGFGDPLFSTAQARDAGVALAVAPLATRGGFRLRNAPHTAKADSAGLALLPRLPDTNDEIREIAKVLGADPAEDIYLQTRATETAVREMDLSKRRVVMFATHGLVPGDLDGLTQPALALTSPEVVPGAGDGFLTMDKVLSLKLNADWVVLSACNTAAGDGAGSEAVSGLGRAFFYAGARALLVSNWPVETVAARLLMTDLFRRQVAADGITKAEALRQSMLALANGPGALDPKTGKADFSYAHPLFWAPFVIVGD